MAESLTQLRVSGYVGARQLTASNVAPVLAAS
jgi:hypothetical protein